MNAEYLAKEAERLQRDEVLNHILDQARADAIEALLRVDASDTPEVTRHQALARAVDEIRARLTIAANGANAANPNRAFA